MRILHLLSSTGYHGAENMAAELIRQLYLLGIKNYLGVFCNEDLSNKDILDKAKPFLEDGTLFPCRGKFDARTIFKLHRYIKKNRINIIHSQKYKTNFYSLLARLGTNCKLVCTCHNWIGSSLKMRFYEKLDKRILRYFDAVVGVSDQVVQEINKNLSDKMAIKVENGIDLKKFYRVEDKCDAKKTLGFGDKKMVGFVGRLSSDKGLEYLLQAIRKIVTKGMDVYCLLVGDGDFGKTLKNTAHSLDIGDRVIFTGKREDTRLIYSAIDVFVLPSLIEAFPMVILEAMACGVPIVSTRVGDIPRIIDDNVSGLLVPPKDAEALANSIEALILNSEKGDRMIKMAQEKVQKEFSSVTMAKKYIEIYQKCLSEV